MPTSKRCALENLAMIKTQFKRLLELATSVTHKYNERDGF